MRLLLDECVPRPLLRDLTGHDAHHVVDMGWSSRRNSELLELMLAERFEASRGPSLGADSRRLVLDSAGGNGNAGAFRRAHAGRVAAGSLVGGTRRLSTGANCRSNRRLLFPRHGDALHLNHTIRFAHDCAVSDAGRSTSVTRDRWLLGSDGHHRLVLSQCTPVTHTVYLRKLRCR